MPGAGNNFFIWSPFVYTEVPVGRKCSLEELRIYEVANSSRMG
jgi:hypothetical protein